MIIIINMCVSLFFGGPSQRQAASNATGPAPLQERSLEISQRLGASHIVDLDRAESGALIGARRSTLLVFGSTGSLNGELPWAWERVWSELDHIDFFYKSVALFSVARAGVHPAQVHDAMGTLYYELCARGANVIGKTCATGIVSPMSKAIVKGRYCGLALEDDGAEANAFKMESWTQRIRHEARWSSETLLNR